MTTPDGRPTTGTHGRPVHDPEKGRPRCTADSKTKLKDGAERGTPEARCGLRPSPGATTCQWHGSKAPQTQKAAKLRLLELVDPAIVQLGRVLKSAEKDSDKLRAVENIMDRAGFPRGAEVTVQDAKDAIMRRLLERREEGDGEGI